MGNEESYLRAILSILARQTFPPDKLLPLIGPEKQQLAYNLCDGSRTQGEIAKELKLDSGNFSKTLARWVDLGIVIKVSQGKEQRPVHIYPVPVQKAGKEKNVG
jgi:DNA-binding MarR family transcriptional regulator